MIPESRSAATAARSMEGVPFDERMARLRRLGEAGFFEEALAGYEETLAWARTHGRPEQVEQALCNRSAVAIELGHGDASLAELRAILMQNVNQPVCHLAAYTLARHFELQKSNKKALFYARIALERAQALGRNDWVARSYNQIANLQLAESLTEEATTAYEKALELMPAEQGVAVALIQGNLGYCCMLQGHGAHGLRYLYKSLRTLRHLSSERHQLSVRLDLCYAHIETGRPDLARRHGLRALRIAETIDNVEGVKNALYLLGEVANLSGDSAAAHACFSRLQREHYPQQPYLPSLLLTVSVRRLVNLHA